MGYIPQGHSKESDTTEHMSTSPVLSSLKVLIHLILTAIL